MSGFLLDFAALRRAPEPGVRFSTQPPRALQPSP